jgi:hypothetical protein
MDEIARRPVVVLLRKDGAAVDRLVAAMSAYSRSLSKSA